MNSMNININKDISQIHDSVVAGLPVRETILAGATIAIGIFVHTALKENISNSYLVNIITGIACTPTGISTVLKYQGLTGEKIIAEFVKSIFLKKAIVLTPENSFDECARDIIKSRQKEGLKNDKISKRKKKREKGKL